MDESMWEKILTVELAMYMVKVTGGTEEQERIVKFFELVKQRVVNYQTIVVMAMHWDTYEDTKQASLAVHHAGMYNASRFIMMMEYLSNKFKKGELK